MEQKFPVYIVGAGPGDPDMLTVKAMRLIQEADIVIVDRLVSAEVQAFINKSASRIYVGKVPGMHCVPQEQINSILVNQAGTGKQIVRLKGGDPYVFGRGSEEAEYLVNHNVLFEVVPGISSAAGCAKSVDIPLTHRGLATGVRFITGHRREGKELDHNWQSLADENTTLVIYMGLTNIEFISNKLMKHGLPVNTPAAAIENGSTQFSRSCFTTLEHLSSEVTEQKFITPTIFIIGRVVSMAGKLSMDLVQSPEQSALRDIG